MAKRFYLGVAVTCLALLSPVYAQNTAASAAPSQPQPAASQLIIYHAGSLTAAFTKIEAAFKAEHPDVTIVDRFGGSVNLARQVTVGGEAADLYASADYEDIDVLLKPKWANYTIRFAQGAMVLVYKIDDPNPLAKVGAIADPSVPFNPNSNPPSIPNVSPNWYNILAQPGVRIGGGDPSTDPGIYRGLLIMQLAEKYYHQPGLYQALYKNDTYHEGDKPPATPADPRSVFEQSDYRFSYEHSALTMARNDPSVRLALLPAEIAMSDSSLEAFYSQASLSISGLAKDDPHVTIKGSRVAWGITLLNSSKNSANAVAFLKFLLTPGEGQALQRTTGPEPIVPAVVSQDDYSRIPDVLRPLVRTASQP
jgi:molybdate/tungstate transport system substrate-binding protein